MSAAAPAMRSVTAPAVVGPIARPGKIAFGVIGAADHKTGGISV
jgi:hypothetical protein